MFRTTFTFILLAFSSATFALPNQLDVIGLIPGVTQKQDVGKKKADHGYIIGGYELFGVSNYIEKSVLG